MPSPFPGVDPFVELSGRWTGFHHILISHCSELLNAELPQEYAALIDKRSEPKQPYIDIISVPLRETVTRIEILCATNKSDDGRDDYLTMRSKLLSRGINLVEVDLLLAGERILTRGQMPVADHYAYMTRGERPGIVEVLRGLSATRFPSLAFQRNQGLEYRSISVLRSKLRTTEGGTTDTCDIICRFPHA